MRSASRSIAANPSKITAGARPEIGRARSSPGPGDPRTADRLPGICTRVRRSFALRNSEATMALFLPSEGTAHGSGSSIKFGSNPCGA
jgi:hypothetical protein